jgi:hypothetical protein
MIDFIGDIHGHADELEALLKKMKYERKNGSFHHPDRTVIFVGDYIDRGPKIVETLKIVRAMVDSGTAIALMGNHEYNAIGFHMHNKEGGHLRPHLLKNIYQHVETIKQFHDMPKGQIQYEEWIAWMKTLPLFYESRGFRAVHACWDVANISFLQERLNHGKLDDTLIYESFQDENELNFAIDETLKGKEIAVPSGSQFKDKQGISRDMMRIKWWADPLATTYRDLSFPLVHTFPEELVDESEFESTRYYTDNTPVFFGHYWLQGEIKHYGNNICCLDYSVAKDGVLAAYQFDGESEVDIKKFVTV